MKESSRLLSVRFLSRYPSSDQGAGQRGLATYMKMLAEPLAKSVNVEVLADRGALPPTVPPAEGSPRVRRVWSDGPTGLLPVLRAVLQGRNPPDMFHVQHEFLGYGTLASNGILLPLLFLCKLRGTSTAVTFHGLLTDSNVQTMRFEDYGYSMPTARLRRAMRLWVRAVAVLADAIVVHEAWQRDALVNEYGLEPGLVHRIPHGVPDITRSPRSDTRTPGRPFQLLFFGYLAPYKGIEKLLQALAGMEGPDFELLIAGEGSPRADGQPAYAQYLRRIDELVAALGARARKIGFVPDEKIEPLFESSDLLILPYTSVLSSSGPLALAMAYGTPVLATRELFEEGSVSVFDGSVDDLREKLERFLSDPGVRERARGELAGLRTMRGWTQVARLHLELYRSLAGRRRRRGS